MGKDVTTVRIIAGITLLIAAARAQINNPAFGFPPTNITVNKKDVVYFHDDIKTPISAKCTAKGNPSPQFEWRKDGVQVEIRPGQVEVNTLDGTLTWRKPQDGIDTGVYRCFAFNSFGTAISTTFKLKKTSLVKFPEQPLIDLTATENKYFSIPCASSPVQSDPAPTFTWYLGEPEVSLKVDERRTVDVNGHLHFLYVKPEDASDKAGPYKCVILNFAGNSLTTGSKTFLSVQIPVGPDKGQEPVLVSPTFDKQNIQAVVGSKVSLECVFSGFNPNDISNPVTIDWLFKDSGQLIDRRMEGYDIPVQEHGRRLVINDVQLEHERTYSCRGRNPTGTISGHISLDVISPPTWADPPFIDATVSAGKDAVFRCKAVTPEGETDEIYHAQGPKWYKNGVPFNPSGDKYEFSPDRIELTVKNVQKGTGDEGDNMCLQCEWKNTVGTIFKSVGLTVIDPIDIQQQPEESYEISPGEVLSLGAYAETEPSLALRYEWFSDNNTVITGNDVYMLSIDGRALKINTTGLVDDKGQGTDKFLSVFGDYRLVISHKFDSEERYFKISSVPFVESIVTASQDLWWIAIVLGILVIFIIVILIICYMHQNRGGVWKVDEKERKAGNDPERELADSGFHDLGRSDDDGLNNPPSDRVSLTESVKPIESDDDDELGQYDGDAEFTKFNEDGSFIGIYGDKKPHQSAV